MATSRTARVFSSTSTMNLNYVFGYGSLICADSRRLTNPRLGNKDALPVTIQNVERVWSARVDASGMTAMDLQFKPDAHCTGVILAVTENELADLDVRERNYNRRKVPLNDISRVDFLDSAEHYCESHPVFVAQEKGDEESVQVWMYMHHDPQAADPSYPIAQSYVDIILRGCLKISKDFARSFIETTDGWHSTEDHWVEDREDPLYVRADSEYSSRQGHVIDQILDEHDKLDSDNRISYDPEDHLEALDKLALEGDPVNPVAIQKVEAKISKMSSSDKLSEQG